MTNYEKLVEALRERAGRENEWYEHGGDIIKAAADAIEALQAAEPTERQVVDYCHKRCFAVIEADLFHELKASYGKTPKRGEWKTTDAFPHRVYCSNCFKTYVPNDRWQIWVDKPGEGGLERNYCPSCGAKMEVQE